MEEKQKRRYRKAPTSDNIRHQAELNLLLDGILENTNLQKSSNFVNELNDILDYTGDKIAYTAYRLAYGAKRSTILGKDIVSAAGSVLPIDLTVMRKALNSYKNNVSKDQRSISRKHIKGLLFKPSTSAKLLERVTDKKVDRISADAKVALAGALEDWAESLIRLSMRMNQQHKQKRLTTQSLVNGIRSESSVSSLVFDTLGITIVGASGGSVVPRAKPGAGEVAQHKEVLRLKNKGNCLRGEKATFSKFVKKVSDREASKNAVLLLQAFVENKLVDIIGQANVIAMDCTKGRKDKQIKCRASRLDVHHLEKALMNQKMGLPNTLGMTDLVPFRPGSVKELLAAGGVSTSTQNAKEFVAALAREMSMNLVSNADTFAAGRDTNKTSARISLSNVTNAIESLYGVHVAAPKIPITRKC